MFIGNSAGYEGGGIANDNLSSLTVSNSTFSDNSAAVNGGGISSDDQVQQNNNEAGDYLVVNNSTFYRNAAYGGRPPSPIFTWLRRWCC